MQSPFTVEASMTVAKQALASVIEDARERKRRWGRLQDIFDLDLDVDRSQRRNNSSVKSTNAKSIKEGGAMRRRRVREEEEFD